MRLALPSGGPALPDPGPDAVERLLVEAERLGVFPAVAWNLGRIDHPRLRRLAAHNLSLQLRQQRLLALLRAAGVSAQAVKGVSLAALLYPNLSWREIEDIDLLVEPAQAVQAFDLLQSAGLVANHPWSAAGLGRQLQRTGCLAPELVFRCPDSLVVELHWDWPADPLPADLLNRPEDYLVYLCRHAGQHFWSHLKWLCDIELFCRQLQERIDWPRFWLRAEQAGAKSSGIVSLELCRRLFESTPAPGLESRSNRCHRRLADEAAAELLNPAAAPSHRVGIRLRLARRRDWPRMVWTWIEPQPQEWDRGAQRGWSSWRVRAERWLHLWRRWGPHRVRRLTAADWRLLAEAYATVSLMETARRLLPSRRLLAAANSPSRSAPHAAPDWTLEKLRRVAWLVDVAANRQPVAVHCLTRSLALSRILKRRGLDPELRLGVRRENGHVLGHAWLEWQGEILNDPAGRFDGYIALVEAAVRQ